MVKNHHYNNYPHLIKLTKTRPRAHG